MTEVETTHEQLQDLRRKVLNNEEVSAAEYGRVLETIRKDRSAGAEKKAKAKKPKTPPVEMNLDDLFAEINEKKQ